ncbi:hypothetical protein HYS47_03720 [Candidatus Woesearchaeota archaeon]|nr:hypothetical protein [Candidatus Woesearchaeota archaeon]
MADPCIAYIDVFPSSGILELGLTTVVTSHPDAIVLGVYDSGKVPDTLEHPIRSAWEQRIPVFGLRQTLCVEPSYCLLSSDPETDRALQRSIVRGAPQEASIDLNAGSEALDAMYEMQPEMLRAGLVPLQGYDPKLVALADQFAHLAKQSPVHTRAMVHLGSVLSSVMTGLQEICSAHEDYASRVAAARQRFSSPGFNKRIDSVLDQSVSFRR